MEVAMSSRQARDSAMVVAKLARSLVDGLPLSLSEEEVEARTGEMSSAAAEAVAAAAAEADAALVAALRGEASCVEFTGAWDLLGACWERVELLWGLRVLRREVELWETLMEVVEVMEAWGMVEEVLAVGGRRERARSMVGKTRRRAALEYGEWSDDVKAVRKLERSLEKTPVEAAPS